MFLKLDKNDVLITNIYVGEDKRVVPNGKANNFDVKGIQYANLDMGCIAFHHTNQIRFRECCGGDYAFYKECLESYNLKFSDIPIGVWVNYSGGASGSNITCK